MAKYRKKPVVVDAEQWFPGTVVRGVIDLRNQAVESGWGVMTAHGQIAIITPGDWIIAEPDGRGFYPCKPDIFRATYQLVDESGEPLEWGQ